jgi:hypothetical protein
MKLKLPNKYTTAAISLMVTSAVLISFATLSDLGDITNATFIIFGVVCAMSGIFALAFSMGEPVDPYLVGMLTGPGSINLYNLANFLGYHGHAYFLPPRVTGDTKVLQFNPVSTYDGKQGAEGGSFREKGPKGLVISPSCELVIEALKKRNAMIIPDTKEDVSQLLRETIEDTLKSAPLVSSSWSGSTVTITFHNYPYIDGCKIIARKYPECCAMSPCPVCSLCGALLTEGLDTIVTLDQCSVSSSSKDVTAVFSVLS